MSMLIFVIISVVISSISVRFEVSLTSSKSEKMIDYVPQNTIMSSKHACRLNLQLGEHSFPLKTLL